MTEFRLIKESEIEEARQLHLDIYPWAPEPNWKSTYVLIEEDSIKGFFDINMRYTVNNLYAADKITGIRMLDRADTLLMNMDYEFFVPDHNQTMQEFLKGRHGLEGKKELPGLLYQVKRGKV